MLPRAQMACSLMCRWGDSTSLMKAGMPPPSTTALVCFEVPEAMLVRAQAASNWMGGNSNTARKLTNFGMRPAAMMLSIGGCFSLERSFLQIRNKEKINKEWKCRTETIPKALEWNGKKPTQKFLKQLCLNVGIMGIINLFHSVVFVNNIWKPQNLRAHRGMAHNVQPLVCSEQAE